MKSIETYLQAKSTGMRQAVPFVKMQALGNDFVMVHERDLGETAVAAGLIRQNELLAPVPDLALALAEPLCDRHFGIGADGLILVRDTTRPDCQLSWLYINSDGSTSAMCGNGLRCLALYAVHTGLVPDATRFQVETEIGAVPVIIDDDMTITTDLGEPVLEPSRVPVVSSASSANVALKQELVTKSAGAFSMTAVSMGNPHCVIFLADFLSTETMLAAAQEIQASSTFPEGVNVEFVVPENRERAVVYVVERGCGPTLACATGAAAVAVAGVLEKRLERSTVVELPGGALRVQWSESDNRVRITGPARIAFEGLFDLLQYLPEDLHQA